MFNFFKKTPSKTFCILPWIHFYANPDGSVLPCCIGDHHKPLGNTNANSVVEIWNNDKFKDMRNNMLEGRRCSECSACYQSEDNGVNSFRQTSNRDYKKYIPAALKDKASPPLTLRYLDVRWSNICNFKCRSCSSTYSSSWATEDNKQGMNKQVFIQNSDSLYDQLLPQLETLDEIYFAGGEPLLTEKHYAILDQLIASGNTKIKLRYNSNLSNLNYKQTSIIDYWNKFENVLVCASLDHYGSRAEYVRDGTVWLDIENNIKTIKQQAPHVELQMSCVVSVFNISTLPEFVEYLIDNKLYTLDKFYPSVYNIINPSYYSVNILSDLTRQELVTKLATSKYSKYFTGVIAYLENAIYDPALRQQFANHTNHYDRIRNQDFAKTFPELVGALC